MNKCCNWLPEAIAVAGVTIGTALAVRGWPSWRWSNVEGQTWAAWAAAVATFLAAGIALLVASGESRRRKRDQNAMAALYAAHLAPKLNRYAQTLRSVSRVADFYDDDEPAMPIMKEKLEDLDIDVSLEQLMHLVPLERQAAHRIARGLALASMALEEIRRIQEPRASSQSQSLRVANDLSDAADLIIVATETCEKLAAKYAVPPSGEELYGGP